MEIMFLPRMDSTILLALFIKNIQSLMRIDTMLSKSNFRIILNTSVIGLI